MSTTKRLDDIEHTLFVLTERVSSLENRLSSPPQHQVMGEIHSPAPLSPITNDIDNLEFDNMPFQSIYSSTDVGGFTRFFKWCIGD
jgi:hypothetical protein